MTEGLAPFLLGVAAGYGIAIPVGAVAILIVNTALDGGFRIGFMAGAGAATADLLYATLAVLAGAVLSRWLAPLALPLRLVGGLALSAIALWGLWRARRPEAPSALSVESRPAWPTFARFVVLTLLNPLTIIYFAAYVVGRPSAAQPSSFGAGALFALGAGLASISWQTMLAALGGLARKRLKPGLRMALSGLGNLIVLAMGFRILWQALATPAG